LVAASSASELTTDKGEMDVGKWKNKAAVIRERMRIFDQHHRSMSVAYPSVGSRCPQCHLVCADRVACLRHLAFQHHRAFPWLKDDERRFILETNQPVHPFVGDEAEEGGHACSECAFKSASELEIAEHVVVHFYQQLKKLNHGCKESTEYGTILHVGGKHAAAAAVGSPAARMLLMGPLAAAASVATCPRWPRVAVECLEMPDDEE